MTEIQGKSILVRISARFELSGVNCIYLMIVARILNFFNIFAYSIFTSRKQTHLTESLQEIHLSLRGKVSGNKPKQLECSGYNVF